MGNECELLLDDYTAFSHFLYFAPIVLYIVPICSFVDRLAIIGTFLGRSVSRDRIMFRSISWGD